MTSLLQHFEDALPTIMADIVDLVSCESPSGDPVAVERGAARAAAIGQRVLGVAPDYEWRSGTPHLRWSWPSTGPRVLLLAHQDTVWPVGTLSTHPCEVKDGVLRGPGCFDMKTGVVMAMHAIAALPARVGVTLLVTSDEEIGSPTARSLIEEEARGCAAVFVLEPSGPGGGLKWSRSGVGIYDLLIGGRAAHAGLEPERGVNATVEVAHQILALTRLARPEVGTTVTPTVVRGGTSGNTVPDEASVHVDVRVTSLAEQRRVDSAIRGSTPVLPGVRLEVVVGPNRPPMPVDNTRALFERARVLAIALGIGRLTGVAVGGGSDGNFTAAAGVPTLDGLGAVGDGAHADDEHVLIDQIPGRTALVTALLAEVLGIDGVRPDVRSTDRLLNSPADAV